MKQSLHSKFEERYASLLTEINKHDLDLIHSSYSFPEKLYLILASNIYDEYIQWSVEGLCFRIIDEEGFVEVVIPKYFKQTKMTSFQRQLNSYGFRKIHRGKDVGSYFHPKFQRDRLDLLTEVHRVFGRVEFPSYQEVVRSLEYNPRQNVSSTNFKRSFESSTPTYHAPTHPEVETDTSSLSSGEDLEDRLFPSESSSPANCFLLPLPVGNGECSEPLYLHIPSPSKVPSGFWVAAPAINQLQYFSPEKLELETFPVDGLNCSSFDLDEDDKRSITVISEDPFREEIEKQSWFISSPPSGKVSSFRPQYYPAAPFTYTMIPIPSETTPIMYAQPYTYYI